MPDDFDDHVELIEPVTVEDGDIIFSFGLQPLAPQFWSGCEV